MKASKFIVLVGGILGLLAFFLPLVSVHRGDFHGTVSAFEIVKGLDVARDHVDAVAASMESASSAKDSLDSIKGITLAIFAPALLLAVIGSLGVARRKFGRGAGTFALLFGLAGLGIGMILKGAAEGDSGIGMTLLLATGVAGVVGGLLALVKPERRLATA